MPAPWALTRALCLGVAIGLATGGQAAGQRTPLTIPEYLLEGNRPVSGDAITFCVDDRAPGSAVDMEIAEALAEALLLDVSFFRVSEMPGRTDQINLTDDLLFVLLSDECNAVIGMKFGDRVGVADFLTVTRPYYETGYVLASTRDDVDEFAALAETGVQVGIPFQSRMNSSVSYYYEDTYRRVFGSERELLDALLGGEIEAGMFYGPELLAMMEGDLFGLTISRVDPVPNGTVPVGMLLFEDQTFMRGLIDEAIGQLTDSGVIADILDGAGFGQLPW